MSNLITKTEVKELAFEDKNFKESKILDNTITAAEENYIRPVLGLEFYEELRAQTGGASITSDNQEVLDLLKPALAYFVKYEALPQIALPASNKGLNYALGEYSNPAAPNQIQQLRTTILRQAEALRNIAIRHIRKEQKENNKYPLYKEEKDITTKVRNLGGIIFSKTKNRN